ncbi:hypothetical protein B0I35DRAFT_414486 [Stachybotrys elegans]|uniref:Uncharacterized protein n=1 Tax=Stachybotrys elegans TaxID=80388 RepID=A0A8K0WKB8_9HYPO|nr:hypothetical protein B0I35DRAFT_414486 [Stachybotrys elegans]
MIQIAKRMNVLTVTIFALFSVACLASNRPYGHISFTPGQPETGDAVGDVEMFGPLISRSELRNQSAMLLARADGALGVDGYGKLLDVPGCFYCPEPEVSSKAGRALLADLTTQKMQSYMRILNTQQLRNKCVFYTASVPQPPRYLSDETSIWACAHRKLTNWHLWPNKFMSSSARFKDFYGIQEPDNWLHSIEGMPLIPSDRGVPTMIQYFENVSEAMARSCSGEVVLVSKTPLAMRQYLYSENIWKNKERPALMNLNEQGKISRFLLVNYNNMDEIWEYDIENSQRGNRVSPEDLLYRRDQDMEHESEEFRILHRDACDTSGLGQRPSQGDPFADNYNNFR